MRTALFFLALACYGQVVQIDAGSATDRWYNTGTSSWTQSNQPNLTPYPSLRYGPVVTYTISAPAGIYTISLDFEEPNATSAGQRVFSVTLNGQALATLDIRDLTGGILKPYTLKTYLVLATGDIVLSLKAIRGNALISRIRIEPYAGVLFQSPMLIGQKCQQDGQQGIFIDPQGYVNFCLNGAGGPRWKRLPVQLQEATQ